MVRVFGKKVVRCLAYVWTGMVVTLVTTGMLSMWVYAQHRPQAAHAEPAAPAPGPGAAAALAAGPWDELEQTLDEQRFRSSLAAYEIMAGGELRPLRERMPGVRMSIGVTGMMFVHSLVVDQVSRGMLRWDQSITLDLHYKSWPRSPLLDTPEGTDFTLADWSRRIMLQSDNTAADHLIAILGREALEREVRRVRTVAAGGVDPGPPEPFLTTAEFHRLKATEVPDPLECYAWSGSDERRAMLDTRVPELGVSDLVLANWINPQFIEQVGWFASGRELCQIARDLHERCSKPPMLPGAVAWRLNGAERTNPKWKRVWGKLGGEPGVLSGVWLIETIDGRVFVMSLVFNDAAAPIPDMLAVRIVKQAMDALASEM